MRYRESYAAAGVLLALFVLAALGVASYLGVTRFADGVKFLEHTHLVIEGLQNVQAEIEGAETAQRSFMLIGDGSYLESYHKAVGALPEQLRLLKQRTSDNPRQQQGVAELELLISQRLVQLKEGMDARRRGETDRSALVQRVLAGKGVMDDMRATVARMELDEDRLLRERSVTFERNARNTTLIIAIGNVLAFAFLLIAVRALRQEAAEKRRAERDARQSAAETQDLYDNAPCGYHSLDERGRFVRINDTELSWLGYTREEVVGRMRFPDLLAPASKALFAQRFQTLKERGALHDTEYEMVRKDGTILYASLSATAVRDERGGFLRSRSTVFDVTRRRDAERELHRSNAFLDSVVEHIPNMIFVKDAADLRFVRLNRAAEELIGYPVDALIGKSDYDLFPPEEADFFVRKDREALAGGLLDILEELIDTRYQGRRVLHTKKIRIVDENGHPRYLLGISEDITERKEAERREAELHRTLQARAAELEASNRELESFSYSVSHDLRAPLRAIDGYSLMLAEGYSDKLDDEGRRLLGVVRNNSKRMARLIDDLLAFSRLGRQPLNTVDVDMARLAREALSEIPGIDGQRGARMIVGELPPVRGDRSLLRQVWVNLLSNAVKYSGQREQAVIEVDADATPAQVVYRIADNGVGFDMRYYDKLFGVFQRLHGADEFPGTGVGLAIVHRVVLRHGGRVWAEGEVGRGATFFFSLPIGVKP